MAVFKSLTDAGGLTKQYLSALGARGWLKLAVVVLFLGGSGLTSQFPSLPVGPETASEPGELWAVAGVVAAGLLIVGAFRYLAAVLEFVFVDSLRSKSLSLRQRLRPKRVDEDELQDGGEISERPDDQQSGCDYPSNSPQFAGLGGRLRADRQAGEL